MFHFTHYNQLDCKFGLKSMSSAMNMTSTYVAPHENIKLPLFNPLKQNHLTKTLVVPHNLHLTLALLLTQATLFYQPTMLSSFI